MTPFNAVHLVSHDLMLEQLFARRTGHGDTARIDRLQQRLAVLTREYAEAMTMAPLPKERAMPNTGPVWLLAMSMDESIGHGKDWGYLVDNDGRRTRPLEEQTEPK